MPSRGRPVSKPLSPTKQITTTPPPTPVLGESPSDLVAQAARAADRGRTADAIALCSSALRRDPELVTAHYLLGLMSVETPEVAARHFRRVIYLDPNHLTARLHVAQCAERGNEVALAIREYRALERLAAAHPIDEVLDSREGITFGMLALIARTGRQRLSDADPNAPSA